MEFEIDDEVYDPARQMPPIVKKILETVQSMPDGKLYTTRRLGQETGHTADSMRNYATHPALIDYRVIARGRGTRRSLYGNAGTIKLYRKETGNE